MNNNGKTLEKTIQLIEETFKDSENTQIFCNHKIEDSDGIKREFDVLLKTSVNGYDLYIAIECKDYGTKISIDRIDSFKTKCDSINQISKRIFVSKNGYQSGAEAKAKTYGIELLTAEEISVDYLENLMPRVSQFNLEIIKVSEEYIITFGSDSLISPAELASLYTGYFINGKTKEPKNVSDIIMRGIKSCDLEIQKLALRHFVTHKDNIENEAILPINFSISFPHEEFYVADKNLNPLSIIKLDFDIRIKFNYLNAEQSGRVIKNINDTIKAHSIKWNMDENSESELIITPNNNFSFYYTENKKTKKLEKLFIYDPKTNEIT